MMSIVRVKLRCPVIKALNFFKLLSALSVSLLWLGVSGAQAAPAHDEWVFEQKHNLLGKQRIYLAADAIKIVNETSGFEILAVAPTWDVYFYRPNEKIIWTQPFKRFIDARIYGGLSKPIEDQDGLVKSGTKKLRDLDISVYRNNNGEDLYWFADNVPMNDFERGLLVCYSRYKPRIRNSGLLIRISESDTRTRRPSVTTWDTSVLPAGDHQEILATQSWKKIPFSKTDFAPPTGYKTIVDPSRITFSQSARKSSEEMFSDLGIGDDLKNSKQSQPKK